MKFNFSLGNAGTAMRPLTAAVTADGGNSRYVLHGVPHMRERPIGDLVTGLKQLGAEVDCVLGANCPPFVQLEREAFQGDSNRISCLIWCWTITLSDLDISWPVKLSGSVSSQYLTALLMVAPQAIGDVEIEIVDKLISVPYVEVTLKLIERSPGNAYAEGDASSASYFLAGAAVTAY
ncbi:3-phosphoshikimate 1-carboxyvinyltransferase [Abeliophyllum distichum]|uniref:3-phosphoshikimate 1-carboxyvinyltransferase n=1 Tax=Abeliophyllum distichum TaxID=126358 RepID=A0ABD1PAB7_9LAMI